MVGDAGNGDNTPGKPARRLPGRPRLWSNHVIGMRRPPLMSRVEASAPGPARFVSMARGPILERRRAPLPSRPCRECGIEVSSGAGECRPAAFRNPLDKGARERLRPHHDDRLARVHGDQSLVKSPLLQQRTPRSAAAFPPPPALDFIRSIRNQFRRYECGFGIRWARWCR